jgi:hypothetical protein
MQKNHRVMQLLAGALSLVGTTVNAQDKQCGPANDTSAALISDLKGWMATEDPNRVALRDRVFRIPVVAESQVSLVTDEQICRKVIDAYGKLPEFAYTPSRVYVIRIGESDFAGYDPDRKGGEFVAVHIFNSEYSHIGGWSF